MDGELNFKENVLRLSKEWKPTYEKVDVPGVGVVYLKKMTVGDRQRFDPIFSDDSKGARVTTMIYCFVDERGADMFTEDDRADLELLDPDIFDTVTLKALALNGLTKEGQDRIRKNLSSQSDGSPSG